MIVRIPGLLPPAEVAYCRSVLDSAAWVDGKVTAGEQSAMAKHNLQIPEQAPESRALGDIIMRALAGNASFATAALPLRVFPPLFNRYDPGMQFLPHVDNAIRSSAAHGVRIRTDLSATLFLTEPEDYEGGELLVRDTFGTHSIKLPAGDMVLYPATSLHCVSRITRGSRWASFFWIQSMVKDDGERALLYELDMGIIETRKNLPVDHPAVLALTSSYHNLLRRWADL